MRSKMQILSLFSNKPIPKDVRRERNVRTSTACTAVVIFLMGYLSILTIVRICSFVLLFFCAYKKKTKKNQDSLMKGPEGGKSIFEEQGYGYDYGREREKREHDSKRKKR